MKDALIVHDEARINLVLYLTEDISKRRGHQKLADLVLNRGDYFSQKPLVEAGKFSFPEISDNRVANLIQNPSGDSARSESIRGK